MNVNNNDKHNEPIDEDVQYQIVQKVRNDFKKQNERVRKFWWIICILSSILSLLSPVIMKLILDKIGNNNNDTSANTILLSNEISMIQCIYSSIMHIVSAVIGNTKDVTMHQQQKQTKQHIGITCTILPICYYIYTQQFHNNISFYIAFGNMITIIGGIFVRRDAINSLKCIQDLEKTKYRFKNL